MKGKKLWGAVAIFAILAGLLIVATVFFSVGFDFSKLSTETYKRRTHLFAGEEFTEIEINTSFFGVKILPLAEGEEPHILLPCSENINHNVTNQDGKLTISLADGRAWYERWSVFNVSNENTVIELHLAHTSYGKLKILAGSGDVTVTGKEGESDAITFADVDIKASTGDINFHATTKGGNGIGLLASTGDITVTGAQGVSLSAKVSTGHITLRDCVLKNVSATTTTGGIQMQNIQAKSMNLEVSSGDIALRNVSADSMVLEADTGDVELAEVLVAGELRAQTETGEISIERSDAGSLWIETDTGDVEIELLSGKIYHVESDTGDTRYPDHDRNGGRCVVKTDTGDVEITVLPQ